MKLKISAIAAVAFLALAMAPAVTAQAAPNPALQAEVKALKASGKSYTYWIGLIFSDIANQTAVENINKWARAKGIKVDPVLINQNNLGANVTAALTAGTMPDALDIGSGLMLQLGSKNLVNLQSVYDELGQKYGGWNKGALNFNAADYAGKGLGVPFGINGNLINRRLDILAAAKQKKTAPLTWDESLNMAIATKQPGAWGFATGNVGDAESIFQAQLKGYGGRIANDAGTKCTLDTQGTRDFLALTMKAFKANAYASDSVTSDGAWDNNKYLGGKTVFIANPGSVYTTLINGSATWEKNPTLAKNTGFSALPGGPVLRVAPSDAWLRAIPKSSKYPELGKDLIRNLAQIGQAKAYYAAAIYGPVLKQYNAFSFWRVSVDPARAGLFDLASNGTSSTFPDINNAAYSEFGSGFGMSQMVQRYLYGGKTANETIAQAQTTCQAIYDKYNK